MGEDSDETRKVKLHIANATEEWKMDVVRLEVKIELLQKTVDMFLDKHAEDAWKIIGAVTGIAGIMTTIWIALRK
jgi:hypothetical protein